MGQFGVAGVPLQLFMGINILARHARHSSSGKLPVVGDFSGLSSVGSKMGNSCLDLHE